MSDITEEMVRKRAEHNDGIVHSLEELSLHQQNIGKIANLDKWCRDLKILYLQGNLISKIENLHRLKKLEYLNLAMNNISLIENLNGCEFLGKLDLTLNFIVDLTSVNALQNNIHLKELFLMGNPCADFEGYRAFVIVTLPQLRTLDGVYIQRLERIQSVKVEKSIIDSQVRMYLNTKVNKETNSGTNESFWDTTTPYTPCTRMKMYEELKKLREVDRTGIAGNSSETRKVGKKLVTDDGKILNVNEAKLPFEIKEFDNGELQLEVGIYRYLDTSLIDVDVQANHITIRIKGKVLQLVLPCEVSIANSVARRSQTTGKLVINMPKAPFQCMDCA